MKTEKVELATFGGGCFWCTEAIFQRLKGVNNVKSGYAGGQKAQPNYEEVSEGSTGHAEVVQINFDPEIISYNDLLEIFFATHDPTTLNRQGQDTGTQYRSVIFYHSNTQKTQIEKYISQLNTKLGNKIVTEVVKFEKFYSAEDYHNNYYDRNKNSNSYCSLVISPKLAKLTEMFSDKIKT